jgi:hypothetical protein
LIVKQKGGIPMNKDFENKSQGAMGKPDDKRATIQDQEEGEAGKGPALNTGGDTTHLVNPGVGNATPGNTVKG